MGASNKLLLLILSTMAFVLVIDAVWTNSEILRKEENLEIEKQLKAINKPAIKSFRTKNGDILDCVDIHKQLAFDHPSLRNHTLQMKPKTIPEWVTDKASRNQFLPKKIKCPHGTVIIKRTTKQDLVNAQNLKYLGFNYPRNFGLRGNGIDLAGHHSAVLEYRDKTFGAKANINVWSPVVSPEQFSLASMWVVRGPKQQINSIQAGWQVNPALYPDGSHMYTYWTADGYNKTGCFDMQCPGFVQVSTKTPLGTLLDPVSSINGPQYEIDISIYRDHYTGNWWFMLGAEYVGYWPKALFTDIGLSQEASFVSWGGEVYSQITEKSPPMGSGYFPVEGLTRSAYVTGIRVIDDSGRASDPDDTNIFADQPKCYDAKSVKGQDETWRTAIFFGGPGGCTFSANE